MCPQRLSCKRITDIVSLFLYFYLRLALLRCFLMKNSFFPCSSFFFFPVFNVYLLRL